jgi:hypothetical protein
MCLIRSLVVAVELVAASLPARGRGEDRLEPHMTVLGVALEETSLSEAQRIPAEVRHNGGDAGASASGECYVGADGTTLALVSNSEMGGGAVITDVQLVARGSHPDYSGDDGYAVPPERRPRCATSASLSESTATSGGLRLGLTRADVLRLLGRPTESDEHRVLFTSEAKVPMTPGQRKALKPYTGEDRRDDYLVRLRAVLVELAGGRVTAIRLTQVTSS